MEHTTAGDTELVTVEELVECIGRRMAGIGGYTPTKADVRDGIPAAAEMFGIGTEGIWTYGLRRKWLEAQDVSGRKALIERRHAARILHEFLKKELQEPDLSNPESAKCLLDLYDCRVCVNHVAQVYGKGIMNGVTECVFGMKEGVLKEELECIVERLFDSYKRMRR